MQITIKKGERILIINEEFRTIRAILQIDDYGDPILIKIKTN